MMLHLSEGQNDGEISSSLNLRVVTNQLLNLSLGAQITATLTPEEQPLEDLVTQLDGFIDYLKK